MTPAASGASPGFERLGESFGLDSEEHQPDALEYAGDTYVAVLTGGARSVLQVRRYERELGVWMPVGGPVVVGLSGPPQLLVSGGRLIVLWQDLLGLVPGRGNGRPRLAAASMHEFPNGTVRWERLGFSLENQGTPSSWRAIDVNGTAWVAYYDGSRTIRVARLRSTGWNGIAGITDRDLDVAAPIELVPFGGELYVGYGVKQTVRQRVGGVLTADTVELRSTRIVRLDPARSATRRMGEFDASAGPARLGGGGAALPTVAEVRGADERPLVVVHQLASDGSRFNRLVAVRMPAPPMRRSLLLSVQDGEVVAGAWIGARFHLWRIVAPTRVISADIEAGAPDGLRQPQLLALTGRRTLLTFESGDRVATFVHRPDA